jgi:nucleotide-binding universal stress UspA family protein
VRDVLVAIDLSPASERVVEQAAIVARGLGGRMHLLHVAAEEPTLAGYDKESLGTFTRSDRARQLLDEHEGLRAQAARLEADGLEVLPLLEMGATVECILGVADRVDAAVIAVGTHGHGAMHHLLLGSVSETLLKQSRRPVLVVPIRSDDVAS